MAYSALPAKGAGDTITLANWTAIKDNFEASGIDVVTTKGDIVAATAADTLTRLAIGANDSTLVPDSGEASGLAWQIQPACRVYNSGNIDPPTSSWVSLTFDSERFDTDTVHDTGSNPARLTVPANGGGLYHIFATVEFDTSGIGGVDGLYGVRIQLNGATVIAQNGPHLEAFNVTDFSLHISTVYSLSATDYVAVQVYTSQDVDIVASGNYSPEFGMIWMRRV